MDFQLSDDQAMLAQSADRFGRDAWPVAERPRLLRASGTQGTADLWSRMAELGWLMLPFSEAQGGLGGSASDIMVVAEAIGRHLLPVPFVSNVVLVSALLQGCEADFLAQAMTGEVRVALALGDGDSRFDHLRVSTTARKSGDAYVLTGDKGFVVDGGDADFFIVPARTGGGVADIAGISLFLVPSTAHGLAIARYRAADNHRHARITLTDVAGDVLGAVDMGGMALGMAVKRATLAQCAEAVGAMDALCEMTLEYLKTRTQFGKPIGTFQALQHRMVDMAIATEEARAITMRATLEAETGIMDKGRMASAAKVRVGQTSLFVARQAIQLHGGIGASDEAVISHYLRRLTMIDMTFGNADHHINRFAAVA